MAAHFRPDRPIEVRIYRGHDQDKANDRFMADDNQLAASGYKPTMQTWTGPNRVCIFLTPLILIAVAMLIFGIYGAGIASVFGIAYILVMSREPTDRYPSHTRVNRAADPTRAMSRP